MEIKLGQLIDANAQRDAVHVAIAPMIAAEMLHPGQHVGFPSDDKDRVSGNCDENIGIVDPFLLEPVMPGQRFYLVLYPNTVTSLRHEWMHPAFHAAAKTQAAVNVLNQFAAHVGLSYDELLEAVKGHLDCGDYINTGENESYKDADWGAMYDAYEIVTGTKVKADNRGWFFNCSC